MRKKREHGEGLEAIPGSSTTGPPGPPPGRLTPVDVQQKEFRLAVRGYMEVLRHYRGIVKIRDELRTRLLAHRPDGFIGVDAPDFNLGLEESLRAHEQIQAETQFYNENVAGGKWRYVMSANPRKRPVFSKPVPATQPTTAWATTVPDTTQVGRTTAQGRRKRPVFLARSLAAGGWSGMLSCLAAAAIFSATWCSRAYSCSW